MHHSSVVPFVLEKESSFVGILEGKFRDPNKARTFSGYGLRFRSFESLGGVQGNVFYLLLLGVIWG